MKPRISYIVPVYNGSSFIAQCLDSFFKQGLSEEEYEVICIDDCSQDDSVSIIQGYINTHSNVSLVAHRHNMRTGTSLNEGVRMAQGQYIWIVGQDDWIEPDWAKSLLDRCETQILDVLTFNYKRVNNAGTILLSNEAVFPNSEVMCGKDYIHKYFSDTFCVYLLGYEWRAIFRREYLEQRQINFVDGAIYEDTTYLFKAMWCSDKIQSINEFIYNYRVNDNSITDVNKRYRGDLTYEFSFVAGKEVLDLANTICEEKEAKMLYSQAIWYFKCFWYKVVPMTIAEKQVFYELVRSHSNDMVYFIERLSISYRLLLHPLIGPVITCCLKPLFILKHLFVKHDYLNK